MNFVKHLLTKAMVVLTAIAIVVGCNGDDDNGTMPIPEGLTLHVDVDNITATTAKVKVTHDDDAAKSWLGFVTADMSATLQELVAEHIAEGFNASEIHSSRQYVTILEGLEPATTYKYVAVGCTKAGVTYGDITSVEFTTLTNTGGGDTPGDNLAGMKKNDAWRVTYVGSDTVEGLVYDHVVRVESLDNNHYVIAIVTAEQWATESFKGMCEALLVDMLDYLNRYNEENDTLYTIADMLCVGDGYDAFDIIPGKYRAVAIGITPDAELSYLYAASEEFEVMEPIASEAYNEWLGEWYVVGMNNAVCHVNLTRDIANRSMWMTGWEGFDDLKVKVEYNSELNSLFFFSQLVAEDYDLGEKYGAADIYLFGCDEDGYFYDNAEGYYYIGIAGILDDGGHAIVRYGVGVSDYPKFEQMFFMAYIDGEPYSLSLEEDVPTYISIMAREDEYNDSLQKSAKREITLRKL
ncbi:MAG: hypothetical protein IJB03_03140 [Alistipes sp.]|nr:hypothetical protein [Alistipes sp.]